MRRICFIALAAYFACLASGAAREIKFSPELIEAMRQVATNDWQTDFAWLPTDPKVVRPAMPSDEFVEQLAAKCIFDAVDLNGDAQDEIIVNVQFGPGATGNATFHVLQKQSVGWKPVGYLQGKMLEILPATKGFAILRTTVRNNLSSYFEMVYVWRQGKYQEARSEEFHPKETSTELVRVSTKGLGTTLTLDEIERMGRFDFEQADIELNRWVQRLLQRLDAEGQRKLRAAQRKWVSFRDAEAESVVALHQKDGLARAYKSASLAKTTQARVLELGARAFAHGYTPP